MPTYVYACKACEHQFEIFQSFTDKARRTCPDCGEKALSKVIFPAGVVFKGSGFYVNDSKGSSSTSTSSAKDSASSDSGSNGSAKTGSEKSSKSKSSKTGSSKDTSASRGDS